MIESLAGEVLRLDAVATPGPWEAEGDAVFDRSGDGVCEVRAWSSTSWRRTRVADEANASLIAAYRTAAPELAREVQRLQAAVAYRPGLPSVEQVRAHEARGGRWQVMDPEGKRPGEAWLEMLCVNRDVIILRGLTCVAALHRMEWAARSSFRPCMPDCTPCPWND